MSQLTILAVDDNQQNLNLLNAALHERFNIILSDGTESIEAICHQHQPDIILLDIMLGNTSGYDICKELRQSSVKDDLIIIFVSALSSLEDKLSAYGAGGDDYICKPIDIDILEQKLLSLEKRIDQHHELEHQYESATEAAFTSMTYSSELGQLMSFFSSTLNIFDTESLYAATQSLVRSFDTNCSAVFRFDNENIRYPTNINSALENEILDLSECTERTISFGHNLLLNSPHCSLLIKKIPIENEEKSGRLKEHFLILLEIIENRLLFIYNEMQKAAERDKAISQLSETLELDLNRIKKTLADKELQSQNILSKFEITLNLKLVSIGLAEEEEIEILGVLQDTKEEFEALLNTSIDLDNEIRDIFNLLKKVH